MSFRLTPNSGSAPLQASCSSLNDYLRGPLGQYLLNVSTAAELCSQTLCSSRGRCLRRNSDSDAYLHLDSVTHSISTQGSKLNVSGKLGEAEKASFQKDFQCQCYSGSQGEDCGQTDPLQQKGAAHPVVSSWARYVLLLVILLI